MFSGKLKGILKIIICCTLFVVHTGCTENLLEVDPRDQITKCENDNFCQSFEVCLSGNCVTARSKGCISDQDCDKNQKCDSILNICRGENENFACDSTKNCPFGFICLQKTCQKSSDLKFCNEDKDCDAGNFCLGSQNICQEKSKCNSNIDCSEGLFCDPKEESCLEKDSVADCVPEDSSTCPLGQFCFDGRCLECQKNSDCPEGLECKKEINACLGKSSCGSDSECKDDYYCEPSLFQCVPKKRPCIVDLDCPVGFICPSDKKICEVSEGKCENDSFEPNNSKQNANTIRDGFNTGLELCIGDQDWFQLDLIKGNLVEIGAKTEQNVFGLVAELFDDQGKGIDKQIFSATQDINIKIYSEDKRTFYLKLSAEGAKLIKYNLQKKTFTGIVKTLDKFEPNDSLSQVKVLSFGRYNDLNLHPIDKDYFSIRSSRKDKTVRLDLLGSQGKQNIDLTIFKSDKNSIYRISSGKSGSRSISIDPFTYGDTSLDIVFSISGDITDYELILTEN